MQTTNMLDITVKTLDSQNHTFSCEDDITVQGFKAHIAETVSVPAVSQRLIYCGRVLQDDKKLNDYDVNGKVIHLVQRPPPQSESRNNSDNQRQSNHESGHRDVRFQYRGRLPRSTMYLGAMPMATEIVENHGMPTPRLSNTLSNSRLKSARHMLKKATELMDRMDDPAVPLHPSSTDTDATENPQSSAPAGESDQESNPNDTSNNSEQATSDITPTAFSGAALINIQLSNDDEDDEMVGSVNVIDANQLREAVQNQAATAERSQDSSGEQADEQEARPQQPEGEVPQASSSNQNSRRASSRRPPPQVPRPPKMAELLSSLTSAQDRLRPYIDRYRSLMSTDPPLTSETGPNSIAENQRVVDGVSECLHYMSHACHALSDIIVDMGQQPPRNLRCRPIIVQHSAIVQAGIPIQLESHINLTNHQPTNNSRDEGNEATRPSSPTPEQNESSSGPNGNNSARNASDNHHSLLGTLLNLPSNVEVSMELSPQSRIDVMSPDTADGSDNDQGQNNNNNNSNGSRISMTPPLAFIRDALRSVFHERHSQMDGSAGSGSGGGSNASREVPLVTFIGQQMDVISQNAGQSTQARSNIETHPTTSTQTRSTARPHVLHQQAHPLSGMGMGQNQDFDPFLPCYSHHARRSAPRSSANSTTSASQSSQTTQPSTTAENTGQSQNTSQSTSTPRRTTANTINFTFGDDAAREMFDTETHVISGGIGLAMSLSDLLQGSSSSDVHISFGPSTSETNVTSNNNLPMADFLRMMNIRIEDFTGRDFLTDLYIFLIRNITLGGFMQLSAGQHTPLIGLRRNLRTFLEHSFPNLPPNELQNRVAEEVATHYRPLLQLLDVNQESSGRAVDIPATVEALLQKFSRDFLNILFNNDIDVTSFAQRAIALATKFEKQCSVVLQHVLQDGQVTVETIASRVIEHLTDNLDPIVRQTVLEILNPRVGAFATRRIQMTPSEIESFIIYKNAAPTDNESKRKHQNSSASSNQSSMPTPKPQPFKLENSDEVDEEMREMDAKPEILNMELDDKIADDTRDLANGEEIPQLPARDDIPTEWMSVIAKDSVRQRRQSHLNQLQGGQMPFSDGYISCLPSKRRKLVEQKKPQLLLSPTPASGTNSAVVASVERLVRDSINNSGVDEIDDSARAVASTPNVRSAFGQAIKDCLNPNRLKSPDFPDQNRFPNATRYFGSKDKDKGESSKSNK